MITFHWHTEPGLLILLIGLAWAYTLAVGPLRKYIDKDAEFSLGKYLLFISGLIVAYLTVGSPLDQIGEQFLFSVHMIQHELLMYVIPPLILFGTPTWLMDWLIRPKAIRKVVYFMTRPWVCGSAFTVIFTVWHIPVLYEAALKSRPIHVLEHWTMFVPAFFAWWNTITPSTLIPRSPYPVRIITVFLLMIGQLPVFAFLSFSSEVFYPTYEFAPRLDFMYLTPIQDQILGGVIMKVCNMIVTIIIASTSFYMWAKQTEKEDYIIYDESARLTPKS